MAAADIFCLPSYREGFGQVIIEAAACAIPVVATRIYGITDAVEEDKTGLLFQAGDIDSLTKALLRLIDNAPLRLQMGMLAKDRATALFSSDQVTRELTDLYLQLLAIAR
jgi:glycosyltransferase involved in cell wall biosynthesis